MSNMTAVDLRRRQLLAAATATTGGAVAAGMGVVFVRSMGLSEAAKAAGAPVEVDIGQVAPGTLATVAWRGKPVWILHRTPEMLAALGLHPELLADPLSEQPQQPSYARNATRAIRPPYVVLTGICTHLGCSPVFRPQPGDPGLGADWPGGFYCPCHGSRFDLAGRVFKNVPAPRNLEVPPHEYLADSRIRVGTDKDNPA